MPDRGASRAGLGELHRAPALRWSAGVLSVTGLLFLVGAVAYGPSVATATDRNLFEYVILPVLVIGPFVGVGAIVALRRPRHLVGWLLLVAGWLLALSLLVNGVTLHILLTRPEDVRLASWAAQVEGVAFYTAFVTLMVVLPLLFPDGHLPSPRWRAVAWLAAVVLPIGVLLDVVLRPGPITSHPELTNPIGVTLVTPLSDAMETWLAGLLFGPLMLAAAAAIITRLRRADAVGRRQFAWVAFPMALLLVFIPLNESGLADASRFLEVAGGVMFVVAFGGIPVGVGVAVLRYRLYEIDRIVSRTVTYALVTLMLVGVYAGSAVALGSVMRLLTGEASSDLVVAASTLAVAAVFNPLRRRAQRVVNRRFYRFGYNVAQTVEAFASRLRESVDLVEMEADLTTVVRDAFQPSAVGIWVPSHADADDQLRSR